jgi:hypothetical protein
MRAQQHHFNEATRLKCLEMARKLAQVRERESKKAEERTASRKQMLGKLVHIVDHDLASHAIRHKGFDEDGSAQHDAQGTKDVQQEVSSAFRHRRNKAMRQCWWLPKELRKMICTTTEEREKRVGARCCMMLRRATLEHYFSVDQLEHVLRAVPKCSKVEAMVTLWAKITDLENFRVYDYIGYDPTVTTAVDHVRDQQSFDWQSYTAVSHRIGPANLFNPLKPEGYYRLDLRSRDSRRAADCIMELTRERGENMFNQHFNDERFHASQSWLTEVPHLGLFEVELKTPKHTANPFLRLDLGRRLLMPGHGRGRWKAIPEEDRERDESVEEADGENDEETELLPDGNLAPKGWMEDAIEKSLRTHAEQVSLVP